MTCKCDVCKDVSEFRKQLGEMPEDGREYWEGLYDRWMNVEQDLDWYKAVADGSWPDSVSILEGWLARAKERNETGEPA